MGNINLTDTFADFEDTKNIDRSTMQAVLKDVFSNLLIKQYGSDENFDIIINVERGDVEILRNRIVVEDEELENENTEIALSEARKFDPEYQIGEEFADDLHLSDFGRRSVLALRQNLTSRILQLEREQIYNRYSERIGEVITGEVYQKWKREALILDDENNELILPRSEQIPGDRLRKGEHIRAVVHRVEMRNNAPRIILSRTAPEFMERLFEVEVPEIEDGLITIIKIVRNPGERAKAAVESYDERVDPVGACVGQNGSRVHSIVREMNGENIDIVNYSSNLKLYIQRSLSPARVSSIKLDEEKKQADVFLEPEEVSKAIGRHGSNINLASALTGYKIDVYRDIEEEVEEDVLLQDFDDEIDQWVLDAFKAIGCDTAKNVLEITRDELIRRTDLEEETVDNALKIFKNEFEESQNTEQNEQDVE